MDGWVDGEFVEGEDVDFGGGDYFGFVVDV